MSGKSLILIFVLSSEYSSIFVRGTSIKFDSNLSDTATKLIYPTKPSTVLGTYWCGHDSQAESYDSLGPATETDKCCRKWHDCYEFILPKGLKYGLRNEHNYKVLDCHCTEGFHYCLKNVSGLESETAQEIGLAYFNVIQPQCLKKTIYTSYCRDSYYDEYGNRYSENKQGNYFCPQLIPSLPW